VIPVPVLFAPYLNPTAIHRCIEAGVNCVPIQAYLDLQRLGGRAEAGAQHLLEVYLRPR
jgi:hypothetical protein